jgi:hypothetical protein
VRLGGRGEGVKEKVGDAVTVADGVGLGVKVFNDGGVPVRVAVAEDVLTAVAVEVGDTEGGLVATGNVAVALKRGVGEGVVDGVGERVTDENGVTVRVAVADDELVGDGVEAGITVFVGEYVGVKVLVLGMVVGDAVNVGCRVRLGGGWLPTRTIIWAGGPRFPWRSLTRTVTKVSPIGKARVAGTSAQNCTVPVPADTNRGAPNSSTVHAPREATATVKPQLPS